MFLFAIIGLLSFRLYKVWTNPLDIPTYKVQKKSLIDEKSIIESKEKISKKAAHEIIVKKDLFRPSRSPVKIASKKFQSVFPKEKPQLFGTIIMNNQKLAIIEDRVTKKTGLYHVNDKVAGFIISDILMDKLILQKNGELIQIGLRDKKKFKPPKRIRKPPKRRKVRQRRQRRRRPTPPRRR